MQDTLRDITVPEDRFFDGCLGQMTQRIRRTAQARLDGFPHYANPETGKWTTTPDGFWTGGYWIGQLWLAAFYTGDRFYREKALEWLDRLSSRLESQSVFRGFLFYYGAAAGYVLLGESRAREVAVSAAQNLAHSFDPSAELIPLGSEAEEARSVGDSESNIDGLVASPLLLWAAGLSNNSLMKTVALKHAVRNAEFCVREDGSVIQSASFNPTTGKVSHYYTHKGVSDHSTWTRAQAWAMLFFTLAYIWAPEQSRLLDLAREVCDWWVANIPEDLVAYWDFDAPREPQTKKDTSGTAIAACALLKLSTVVTDRDKAAYYYRFGRETLRFLAREHLTPVAEDDQRPVGILTNGCFDHREGVALSDELIWGSYYLYEGLGVLTGRLPVARI
jgi:unsaturated chondroitin disaccharide hydrolase